MIPLQLLRRYVENKPTSSSDFLSCDEEARSDSRNWDVVCGDVIWWSSDVGVSVREIRTGGSELSYLQPYR